MTTIMVILNKSVISFRKEDAKMIDVRLLNMNMCQISDHILTLEAEGKEKNEWIRELLHENAVLQVKLEKYEGSPSDDENKKEG